jgi:protein transport protein SEC31
MHNLQSLEAPDADTLQQSAISPQAEGADIFDLPQTTFSQSQPSLNLLQAPKWLKTPAAASWGYGGKLVSICNLPGASGANQSSVIHLRDVTTEKDLVERAQKLKRAADGDDGLQAYVEERAKQGGTEEGTWKALLSLFDANSRDELVNVLGFSKEQLRVKVEEAIATMSAKVKVKQEEEEEPVGKLHEPVVSFAEPTHSPEPSELSSGVEGAPSEVSNSAASDATTTKTTSALSTLITEPETASLFSEDIGTGTPQTDNAADFFSSMGTIRGPVPPHVRIPHTNPAPDSSVAATVGSRPSSAASDALLMKNLTFKMYPKEESVVDKLITQSLVVGDFESAVSLCLSAERFADAILLAVRGGDDLLQRTQKAYFEKKTTALPYLRVFQSIVTNDLSDIVQNADLREWQEIFVVLCTFAKADDFWNLAEQLGQRLEFQGNIIKSSDLTEEERCSAALGFRKNATLCYLAASKLEKVVNIWLEEMKEMEDASKEAPQKGDSRYATHAQALQTFIEKVTVFRRATKYVDADLSQSTPIANGEAVARAYKLSSLYDRYFEYADLLAGQGLVSLAVEYINLVPSDYKGVTNEVEFDLARERLLSASGAKPSKKTALPTPAASTSRAPAAGYPYDSYTATQQLPAAPVVPAPVPYAVPSTAPQTTYGSRYASMQPPSQPSHGVASYGVPNGGPNTYGGGHYAPPSSSSMIPPPPVPISISGGSSPALTQGPPRRAENKVGGWNDAPPIASKSGANSTPKHAPIFSPFPQTSSPAQGPGSPGMSPTSGLPPPPPRGQTPVSRIQQGPPRPSSGQAGLPPPSRGTHFAGPPPPIGSGFAQQQRGMPPPPPIGRGMAPPQQGSFPPNPALSSPQQHQQQLGGAYPPPPGPRRVTSPPQGPPPMRAAPPMMSPPQMRGTPPPHAPPPQHGSYAPRMTPTPGSAPPPPTGGYGGPIPQQAPPPGPPPSGPPRAQQAPPPKPLTPAAPPKAGPAPPKYRKHPSRYLLLLLISYSTR